MSPARSTSPNIIDRQPLREHVRRVVLQRILQGDLSGGTNLNEAKLAADLGVSRTPVREALLRLEQERFLDSDPGRGFFVAEMTAQEVRDLFPIIGALESMAVRWAGPPSAEALAELDRINDALGGIDADPETALDLNGQWHRLLVRHSENRRLRDMIERARQQAYRYEYNYFMQGAERTGTSVNLHKAIMDPLHRGDVEAACTAIAEHWLADLDLMLPRSESR